MPQVGPTKQRFHQAKFKLTAYELIDALHRSYIEIRVELILKYLNLVDINAIPFVCKSFYEIVYYYEIYCEHQLSEQIICKTSVINSSLKHFLVQNFSFLFRSDTAFNSFTRYKFENLSKEISVTNVFSHFLCCSRFNKFNNVPAEAVHLLGLRMQNIFVNRFGIILDVTVIECLTEILRRCLLNTTRFLLG